MKLSLTSLAIAICLSSSSQNLVPNGSFELFSNCPTWYSQADYATGWIKSLTFNYGHSNDHTDYFNSCTTGNFSTPLNIWGNQNPSDGVAYQGMAPKYTPYGFDYRENSYIQLSSPLVIGTPYYVSFQISLADEFRRATDNMGIKFSTVPNFDINNFAHVFCTTPVTNQNGWVTIQSIFTADSAYNYLGLGNFFKDQFTNEVLACQTCNYDATLYYIDNVKVFKVCEWVDSLNTDSLIDNGDLRINQSNNTLNYKSNIFNCYPSLIIDELTLEYNFPELHGNFQLEIFNSAGILVKSIELGSKNRFQTITNISNVDPGLYICNLKHDGKLIDSKKIIKN